MPSDRMHKNISFLKRYFNWVWEYMYIYVKVCTCECRCALRSEEDIEAPGAGVTGAGK